MIDAKIPDPKLLAERRDIIADMRSQEIALRGWRRFLADAEAHPGAFRAQTIELCRSFLRREEDLAQHYAERLRHIETETGVAGSA
jgi:uncharacterized protein YbjT (DUF2867 family)